MKDLIERQAAIEAVEEWFFNFDDNRMPKEVLLEIPSEQAELDEVKMNEVRRCGSTWMYCNGNCRDCEFNATTNDDREDEE